MDLESYRKAGSIAAQALNYGKSLIRKGASIVSIADSIEAKIKELGGQLAFPVQLSSDHIAAHFCPVDEIILDRQLVCLDVGVHVDGYIGDNALTVDLSGENSSLVEASRKALDNAIKIIRPGTTLAEVGKTIQETIQSYGFSPVRNLSGHGLGQYNIHSPPNIPNIEINDQRVLEENQVIAIEPFATSGEGIVQEGGEGTVYALISRKPVRSPVARQLLKDIETYKGLPFAKRWLLSRYGIKANQGLSELLRKGIIRDYPPLSDKAKGLVSQAEHTIIVKDKPEIITCQPDLP